MKKVISAIFLLSLVNAYGQDGGIKITNDNYKHSRAMWSPVEDLILFESNMEGKKSLYTVKSNGENIKRLTSLDYEDWIAAWSPDGKKIAYSSMRNDKYQIFIYDLNNDTHRQLITSEFSDYGPSWSPDGKQIAYSSKLSGRNVREIFIVDVDGKNKKRLTHNKKINGLPVFSADGQRIFYQSTAGSNSSSKPDIFSYHLSTSQIERITFSNTGGGIDPFIYAPNKKLAFFTAGSGSPNGPGTYWIDLETRKMTKFDVKAKNPGHPNWSHDGQFVTVIDRKQKEIYVYDIENSKSIQITDKAKIGKN
ncbi:PD40 domain-containing protein [Roseivirga sp. E12]|uniref:TolB family protein n=1 Tax=Roseivirga sp. E12 TaxID=2819237 RepID=UPI001ABC7F78|nr:PD40 domain-containing protein [Roseivirga sp. E12]MBO3699100.1 PD40 domain-containing protein [Roseivirga sp. E12]